MSIRTYGDVTVLLIGEVGGALSTPEDATAILEEAFAGHARVVAIPAERFDALFFDLATGIAAEFLQKFATYGIAVAIVGDLTDRIGASAALSAFVVDSNAGDQVWFVPETASIEALVGRLGPA